MDGSSSEASHPKPQSIDYVDGSSSEHSHPKRRSIDYLLAGESVKTNRLLARFANGLRSAVPKRLMKRLPSPKRQASPRRARD